ncbi:innexin domain-containing protein [Ditylenchus destructor]|uniref:Innexin n=1 Tax=Ditylenchus destructor TaxID=166010 RepID=A0AAD4MNZ7_9BILA|nr:innexin domain-containing protein [Ditylenchus destructor]
MLPMIGLEYLNKIGGELRSKLKKAVRPLLKDGIGDRMDKGNLWLVPGFTIFAFAILWTAKLSKIALEESTCKGASIFDFKDQMIDEEAKRHCQTANRYFVAVNEPFSYDQKWRQARQVKNPEWCLWFWAPIVFVMYVLTRFIWSLLLENQGINFPNIVNACQSVMVDNDGVTELDYDKLYDRVPIISDNFRCAFSSHAFAAFIAFEFTLVLAPLFLLVFFLPLMIGSPYRTYGLDVIKAWWEHREWRDVPLAPAIGQSSWSDPTHYQNIYAQEIAPPRVPLIPRITYCDYHFVTLGNDHILTYRCYLDANWHERTALFTWFMLVFLIFINLCNLYFWLLWAFQMRFRYKRQQWVLRKWLNGDDFSPAEREYMNHFAGLFKMGNLLLLYYIEAHTDRVVASAFCTALFQRWLEKESQIVKDRFALDMGDPKPDDEEGRIGWNLPQPMMEGAQSPAGPFVTAPTSQASNAESPAPNAPMPETPPSSAGLGYSSSSTAKLQDEFKQRLLPPPHPDETPRTRPQGIGGSRLPYGYRGPNYITNIKRRPDLAPLQVDPRMSTKEKKRFGKDRSRGGKEDERRSNASEGLRWRCSVM